MGVVYDETSGIDYATLSAAITGSSSNDTLLVPAGSYVENFPDITHNLTIDAVGGLASLTTPQSEPVNGRAILNVPLDAGVSLSISGLEISGATRPEPFPNGAGILFETGNGVLTVTNSYIHNNEDGILTGGPDAASPGGVMSVVITHSQISGNGAPPGSSYAASGSDHNIYAGALTSFTLTDSYVSDEQGFGHEVKSRALSNTITGNRIQDGPSALVSYDIDLPDGGNDLIAGNVIEKGAGSVNHGMIHFGGEGTYAGSNLVVSDNTFINDGSGAIAVLNQTQDSNPDDSNYEDGIPATIAGNTLYDVGVPNLYQDEFGPPYDIALNNVFITGAAPSLDTSPGYSIDAPEPAGIAMLLFGCFALLSIRLMRKLRPRRCRFAAGS
jgi:Right handed beta helix region